MSWSCIDQIDINYNMKSSVLTVEGQVSDQLPTTVLLSISKTLGRSVYIENVKNATVNILVGDGTIVNLTEVAAGVYSTPADFRGKINQTYQLSFKLSSGVSYKSTVEKLGKVADIKKVYHNFNLNGILDGVGKRVIGSSFDVYVDFDDPADQKNYYLWKWQLYEMQDICITCEEGYLNSYDLKCIRVTNRSQTPHPTYDYQCNGNCWDILFNQDINILSDVFSNGKNIVGRKIAPIPFYSDQGCLVEIQQTAISSEAYQYYSLLRDQSQTTGTLTDTPPATVVGNIQNVADSKERVVGFFGASATKTVRHWIDRTGYKGYKSFLIGHDTNLEPSVQPSPPLFEIRPPFYPCTAGRTRTPTKPTGWK